MKKKQTLTTTDDAMSAINFVAENLISGASSPKMSEVNNLQITPVMISLPLSKHLTKSSKCKLAFNLIFKASSLMKIIRYKYFIKQTFDPPYFDRALVLADRHVQKLVLFYVVHHQSEYVTNWPCKLATTSKYVTCIPTLIQLTELEPATNQGKEIILSDKSGKRLATEV